MDSEKLISVPKPFNCLITPDFGGLILQVRKPGTVRPLIRPFGESVMNRVIVDIGDKGAEVVVGINQLSFEVRDKKAAFSIVDFVERFCVGVKKG